MLRFPRNKRLKLGPLCSLLIAHVQIFCAQSTYTEVYALTFVQQRGTSLYEQGQEDTVFLDIHLAITSLLANRFLSTGKQTRLLFSNSAALQLEGPEGGTTAIPAHRTVPLWTARSEVKSGPLTGADGDGERAGRPFPPDEVRSESPQACCVHQMREPGVSDSADERTGEFTPFLLQVRSGGGYDRTLDNPTIK